MGAQHWNGGQCVGHATWSGPQCVADIRMDRTQSMQEVRVLGSASRWVAFALLVGLLVGCRSAVERDIPGTYEYQAGAGRSTLILRPDHSMSQIAQPKQGELRNISGTWKFENGLLTAKPGLFVPGDQSWIEDGANGVDTVGLSGVEISVDPDRGRAYRKIK